MRIMSGTSPIPFIDSENGTCKVTGLFLNAGKHVKPGALVNVTIIKRDVRSNGKNQ